MFEIDSQDLIWRDFDGTCYSTVSATIPESGIVLNFFGDFFLRYVITVYDYGKDEMRFAQRLDGKNGTKTVPSTGDAGAMGVSMRLMGALFFAVAVAAML